MKQNEQASNAYLSSIERYLNEECFCYPSEPQQVLFEAMRYSLLAGGKRLRPIFTLDFCRMTGGDWESALPFAAAVEMIQTYSLIHDDLPCMDDDDLRRGIPTNHKVYGEAVAVLAGDALQSAAFACIANCNLDAQKRIDAVKVLSNAIGELGMVGGQVLDIQAEQRQCTKEDVLNIQSRKTGALISAACMLGVIAAGGTAQQLCAAKCFGDYLGLAFQIRDDMLDVIGNTEELGKAVGTDAAKNTFVQLYGLEACEIMVAENTRKAIESLQSFDNTAYMTELAQKLTGRTV